VDHKRDEGKEREKGKAEEKEGKRRENRIKKKKEKKDLPLSQILPRFGG
jgi:hypothetical protein